MQCNAMSTHSDAAMRLEENKDNTRHEQQQQRGPADISGGGGGGRAGAASNEAAGRERRRPSGHVEMIDSIHPVASHQNQQRDETTCDRGEEASATSAMLQQPSERASVAGNNESNSNDDDDADDDDGQRRMDLSSGSSSIVITAPMAAAAAPPVPLAPSASAINKTLDIADFVGEIGLYQLSLTVLTFVRYMCVAMMTNTGPLIAPKLANYSCLPASAIEPLVNYPAANKSLYLLDKCQLELKNGSSYECSHWLYNKTADNYEVTLTDSFDLICGRDWLRSAFQSSVSVGVTVASIVFGSFSDEHGRKLTLKISYTMSLVAGLVSYWAPSFLVYTISRAICSMSDLGIVSSLYTIIVETFGNKYRGTICLIVFTGWSMGVMVMPYVTGYFLDFRKVMLFTVVCHAATLPWLMTVGESIRWLLINGRLEEAQLEIRRICKWNGVNELGMAKVESRFQASRAKYQLIAERNELAKARELATSAGKGQSKTLPSKCTKLARLTTRALFGGFFKVGQILKSRELTITTLVMVWTTFNSELLYMLFILINSDVGDNVVLNYAIGGVMEILATLISIVMFARLTRRFSLSSTLTTISMSIFLLAFTHQEPRVSVWALNFTKFAISTLSSLIYVTVTELFPTSLRQTGMGLAATLGSFGAVIAPFIRTELTDLIGMTNVMLMLCLLPLSAALLIPLHLRETKGLELADDVDEIR